MEPPVGLFRKPVDVKMLLLDEVHTYSYVCCLAYLYIDSMNRDQSVSHLSAYLAHQPRLHGRPGDAEMLRDVSL